MPDREIHTARVRAVPVVRDQVPEDLARFDYADAFELFLSTPDRRSAQQWLRAGLEQSPAAVRLLIRLVHRHVLRFDLAPTGAPGTVLGWTVVHDETELCRLEASSPLARGVILGRRRAPDRVALQTFVFHRRPAARRVWAVVGPLHRTIAPLLLRRAARVGDLSR